MQVATTDPVKAATIDLAEEATTDPMGAARVIWTARLRTGRVADNRANASRAFKAAALIASVAAEVDPVATASVAAGDLAAVALAALAVEDSAGLAVAGDDEN
jgi:hypothetical protein